MPALTPKGAALMGALEDITRKMQAIYAQTEQFAGAKSGEDQIAQSLKRRYGRFKRSLMGAGFDSMAQLAGSMEIAAGRSASRRTKARILREGAASLKFQLEMVERQIRQEHSVEKKEKGAETASDPEVEGP